MKKQGIYRNVSQTKLDIVVQNIDDQVRFYF